MDRSSVRGRHGVQPLRAIWSSAGPPPAFDAEAAVAVRTLSKPIPLHGAHRHDGSAPCASTAVPHKERAIGLACQLRAAPATSRGAGASRAREDRITRQAEHGRAESQASRVAQAAGQIEGDRPARPVEKADRRHLRTRASPGRRWRRHPGLRAQSETEGRRRQVRGPDVEAVFRRSCLNSAPPDRPPTIRSEADGHLQAPESPPAREVSTRRDSLRHACWTTLAAASSSFPPTSPPPSLACARDRLFGRTRTVRAVYERSARLRADREPSARQPSLHPQVPICPMVCSDTRRFVAAPANSAGRRNLAGCVPILSVTRLHRQFMRSVHCRDPTVTDTRPFLRHTPAGWDTTRSRMGHLEPPDGTIPRDRIRRRAGRPEPEQRGRAARRPASCAPDASAASRRASAQSTWQPRPARNGEHRRDRPAEPADLERRQAGRRDGGPETAATSS